MCSCNSDNASDHQPIQNHIISFYDEAEWIYDFSDAESKELLQIFNISIPAAEENAYIYSIGRIDGDVSVMYFIEIGGINDYETFFSINSEDPYRSGVLTLSVNEIYGNRDPSYYITYSQHFRKDKKANSDEANQIFDDLNQIYYNH